uniref:Uncharacterized protein n=1 Tax=Callithrix jacchus TaxID=9483 RepID=A0A8I3W4I6_CALJA
MVIPAFWEAEASRSLELRSSRDRDHPGQPGETPSLLKIQKKLARRGGACLWSQLLWRLRRKNRLNPGGGGCSELRLCHRTPAWPQNKTPSQKRKNIQYAKVLYFGVICLWGRHPELHYFI